MQAYSKAIAAFVSSLLAMAVSFGWIEQPLADLVGQQIAPILSGAIAAGVIATAVFHAPPKKG